jgi:hypothetical protein
MVEEQLEKLRQEKESRARDGAPTPPSPGTHFKHFLAMFRIRTHNGSFFGELLDLHPDPWVQNGTNWL